MAFACALLVAAGVVLSGGLAPAAAASSASGEWDKVPFSATGLERGSGIGAVTSFRGSVFAAGAVFHRPRTSSAPFGFEAAVWRSAGGRHWRRVGGNGFGAGQFVAVIEKQGTLFGFAAPLGADTDTTTVWSSVDGTRWEMVTDHAPSRISSVVVAGKTFVAVGTSTDPAPCGALPACPYPTVWTSRDGREWTPVHAPGTFPPGVVVTGITTTSRGALMIGFRLADAPAKTEPLVWSSPNGVTWRRVRHPRGLDADARLSGAMGTRRADVLSVGVHTSKEPPASPTTTVQPTRTVSRGGAVTARLCFVANGSTTAWTTTTGQRWQRVSTPALRDANVRAVIASHGRWIAGGSQGDCASTGAVVYTSSDGRHWQRGAADPQSTSDKDGPLRYVTALGPTTNGAIAVVGSLDAFASDTTGPDVWLWAPRG